MATTHSPLRYPGGKSSLCSFLAQVIRLNGLGGGVYIEPYAGGAGAAISLLYQGAVNKIVINDYDPAIYAFWNSILCNTEDFVYHINTVPLTIEEWQRQKDIIAEQSLHTVFEVGFAAFFLNRCNRSGILMAGPIGGKGQSGKYTLGVRFNRSALSQKVSQIAHHKDSISLYNLDAIDFIKTVLPDIDGKKLIYLDPPYYEKGKMLYLNAYEYEDHVNLAWVLSAMSPEEKWVLTYDDTDEIRELYKESVTRAYALNYFAHHARKGSELLIAPPQLSMPEHVEISNILPQSSS